MPYAIFSIRLVLNEVSFIESCFFVIFLTTFLFRIGCAAFLFGI